jgi:hypothetical protein
VEDDHVDRPGVDVQQCMKLTGTNSPIGLIVLIDHVHQRALGRDDDAVLSSRAHRDLRSLPCRRRAKRLAAALRPVWVKTPQVQRQNEPTCSQKTNEANASASFSINIALKRPGGHGGAAAPVPIPNTAVKRPSANGTSSQDAGE